MNANELAERIAEALETLEQEDPNGLDGIRTYGEDGVLTNNAGLTISIGGQRFQVTVVEA